MLFMNNTKKKKHPLIALMASGFAVFGAYSMVSAIKRGVCDKMSCMINKMKKMKPKLDADSENCCDSEGE